MRSPPERTAGRSAATAHRAARFVEITLLVLTVAGIGVLMTFWVRLDALLAPGESPDLVRARLLRGILSLAVPLVALLSIAALRGRAGALMIKKFGDGATLRNARVVWIVAVMAVISILVMDTVVIIEGFRDIDFGRDPLSIFFGA